MVVLALSVVAAPAASADVSPATCAKQARAVATAERAVSSAQKTRARTPAARKQRSKRLGAAKARHARARKALSTCRSKARRASIPAPTPTPAPPPAPAPEPVPAPPVLSLVATTVGPLEPWRVLVAAPEPPAGMVYRLAFMANTGKASCSYLVVRNDVSPTGETQLSSGRPWCAGPGWISLHQVPAGSRPLPLGALVARIDVAVSH